MAYDHKANRKRNYRRLKLAVYQKLGNRCSNPACQWLNADGTRGYTDERCLQIDHVHGDGNKERHGDCQYLRNVLKDANGRYQLLCSNCNWIKLVEKNEWVK